MKSRLLSLIAIVGVALAVFLFWSGPHSVRGSGQNIVVLCPSCSFDGVPSGGYLALMDANSEEIWLYSDAAFEGKASPIRWGKLTLGQPVARLAPQATK